VKKIDAAKGEGKSEKKTPKRKTGCPEQARNKKSQSPFAGKKGTTRKARKIRGLLEKYLIVRGEKECQEREASEKRGLEKSIAT